MKSVKLIVTFVTCCLIFGQLIAQTGNLKITDIPSMDVYKIQAALGTDANYFVIQNYMDSLINNGIISDTAEDEMIARYSKWDWFWKGRTTDIINPSNRGDFSSYFKLMNQYANTTSTCPTNSTNIQYNWNLKGPIQLPTQTMGRVDVLRTLPNTPLSTIAFAGTPNSGLWRTTNYLVTKPVWTNITDVINLPNVGIKDMVIDPTNPKIAYITSAYSSWSGYSAGLFTTTNLDAAQPTWTRIFPTSTSFQFRIGRVLLNPSDPTEVFVLKDNEVHILASYGTTPSSIINVGTLLNSTDIFGVSDFIFDKNDNTIIYLSGTQTDTSTNITTYKLWKYNRTISNTIVDVTNLLSSTPKNIIQLDNGQKGTYFLYAKQIISNIPQNFIVDKTVNSGISFVTLNQLPTGLSLSEIIFDVSDINENIIYSEICSRLMTKSLNGGLTFAVQTSYNLPFNGVYTHADARGFYMIKPSPDGLNDEFFVGND